MQRIHHGLAGRTIVVSQCRDQGILDLVGALFELQFLQTITGQLDEPVGIEAGVGTIQMTAHLGDHLRIEAVFERFGHGSALFQKKTRVCPLGEGRNRGG